MTGGARAGITVLDLTRERGGCGQVVDVSMLEGILSLMTVPATRLLAGGADEVLRPTGNADQEIGTLRASGVIR
jgi:crotonobetainyl-CoA:carnitine CoA-transferase CaiB-like acyl-CoA transferase